MLYCFSEMMTGAPAASRCTSPASVMRTSYMPFALYEKFGGTMRSSGVSGKIERVVTSPNLCPASAAPPSTTESPACFACTFFTSRCRSFRLTLPLQRSLKRVYSRLFSRLTSASAPRISSFSVFSASGSVISRIFAIACGTLPSDQAHGDLTPGQSEQP